MQAYPEVPQRRIQPPRALYLVVAFGAVIGVLLLAVTGWALLSSFPVSATRVSGNGGRFTIDRPGTYAIAYEQNLNYPHVARPPDVRIVLVAADGARVPVEAVLDGFVYDFGGHQGRVFARFTAQEPGQHTLLARGNSGRGSVTFAVGREATTTLLILGSLADFIWTWMLPASVIGWAVIFVRRAASKRHAQAQGWQPSSGGASPQPGQPFGGHPTGPAVPPSPYPDQPGVYQGQPLATWGMRAGAAVIDALILWVPLVIGVTVSLIVAVNDLGGFVLLGLVVLANIGARLYSKVLLQGRTGQSWGKRLLKIRLVGIPDGRPLGAGVVFVRGITTQLNLVALCLGYLWPLWDRHRQTFADKLCDSLVLADGSHSPPPPPYPGPGGYGAPGAPLPPGGSGPSPAWGR